MMLLAAAAAAIAAGLAPASTPQLGQLVGASDGRCYRVMQLDTGPGGVRYAWLLYAGELPRSVLHEPAATLRQCSTA
jgi:hypothetical protein